MELITIILSGLLAGITPAGLILDSVIESNLRSRLPNTETLEVRIDNAPTHQILQGKIDKVRLASRGLFLTPELRVDLLEIETDPVAVNMNALQGEIKDFREVFHKPLNAGVHLAITENDINAMLASETWQNRIQEIAQNIAANLPGGTEQNYQVTRLDFDFLAEDRLEMTADIQSLDSAGQPIETLNIQLQSGLALETGSKVALVEPQLRLNGEILPSFITDIVQNSVNQRLDLKALSTMGITARLLHLDIDEDTLDIAAFVRIEPSEK